MSSNICNPYGVLAGALGISSSSCTISVLRAVSCWSTQPGAGGSFFPVAVAIITTSKIKQRRFKQTLRRSAEQSLAVQQVEAVDFDALLRFALLDPATPGLWRRLHRSLHLVLAATAWDLASQFLWLSLRLEVKKIPLLGGALISVVSYLSHTSLNFKFIKNMHKKVA